MGTKVKGLLKGLRYISQIFDEPKKEQQFHIGLPTDVKHVAHIGFDGPKADSPSWMNGFESSPGGHQSSPTPTPTPTPTPIPSKYEGVDSSKRIVHKTSKSLGRDQADAPKPSRRTPSIENVLMTDSPKREKSRQSRRHSKDSKDNKDSPGRGGSGSLAGDIPDIPKKTRRKKSKDSSSSSRTSKSRLASGSGSDHDPESYFKSHSTNEKGSCEAC